MWKHFLSFLSAHIFFLFQATIRKESCWLASNIAAGTHEQISALMRQSGVMKRLIDIALNEQAWDVRKGALRALSNICTTGSDSHIQSLIGYEGLQPLARVLCETTKNTDATILCTALGAIERVLEVVNRTKLDYGRLFDHLVDYLENDAETDLAYERRRKATIKSYLGSWVQHKQLFLTDGTGMTFSSGQQVPNGAF
jgi:hypothetical protein